MPLELKKARPVKLRAIGLDERWLQDRIAEDPSILGLGDLRVIQREKPQAPGGRIDFLMHDDDSELRYEIEVMLGALDESHIIRTIEYWDLERQRYPTVQHRAVIAAEEITARFFNVIRLLNRAVPMIALQLSTFQFGETVVLHFTKVLDVWEEMGGAEEEEPTERADRHYWQETASPESLSVADKVTDMLKSNGHEPRVTYNKGHIAVGTTGQNFRWFHPRKQASHCHVHFRVGNENRDDVMAKLTASGVSATPRGKNRVKVAVTSADIQRHAELVRDLLVLAEERSRKRGSIGSDED